MLNKKVTLILSGVSFGIIALAASPALAGYGAIAYSRTTGAWGRATNNSQEDLAQSSALLHCNTNTEDRDCAIEVRIENQCGALARKNDNSNFVTSGFAQDRSDAGNEAIAACGDNCQLVTSVCSWDDY